MVSCCSYCKNLAYVSENKYPTFVDAPLKYNRRPTALINQQGNTAANVNNSLAASFDRLVIYKNKLTGQINQRIVTFVPTEAYLASHHNDISSNHINKLAADFNGFLIYKDWSGKPLFLIKFLNGKPAGLHIFNGKKNIKSNAQVSQETCTTWIITYYEQDCWEDYPEAGQETCSEWTVTGYDTYTECTDDGDGNADCLDTGTCPILPTCSDCPAQQDIKDLLKDYPCAQIVIEGIPHLTDTIANLINKTFGKSDALNIIYRANPQKRDDNTHLNNGEINPTLLDTRRLRSGEVVGDIVIDLNPTMLNTATKEYILAVVYHEALHAYLDVIKGQLGTTAFNAQFPEVTTTVYTDANGNPVNKYLLADHSQMAENFLGPLTHAIKGMHPNFTDAYAKQIAEEGIIDDPSILNTNKAERGGTSDAQGTKCPH